MDCGCVVCLLSEFGGGGLELVVGLRAGTGWVSGFPLFRSWWFVLLDCLFRGLVGRFFCGWQAVSYVFFTCFCIVCFVVFGGEYGILSCGWTVDLVLVLWCFFWRLRG